MINVCSRYSILNDAMWCVAMCYDAVWWDVMWYESILCDTFFVSSYVWYFFVFATVAIAVAVIVDWFDFGWNFSPHILYLIGKWIVVDFILRMFIQKFSTINSEFIYMYILHVEISVFLYKYINVMIFFSFSHLIFFPDLFIRWVNLFIDWNGFVYFSNENVRYDCSLFVCVHTGAWQCDISTRNETKRTVL